MNTTNTTVIGVELMQQAEERIREAYPDAKVVVQNPIAYPHTGRLSISAVINGQVAFGAGSSINQAISSLLNSYKPYTTEERVALERTHAANLVPTFSDKPYENLR